MTNFGGKVRHKNGKALPLSKLTVAQSVSYYLKSAEAFSKLRLATLHVHAQAADLYPDDQLAVSLSPVSTRSCFHTPRILANAVPLGFCCGGFSSTAGYVPATWLNFR